MNQKHELLIAESIPKQQLIKVNVRYVVTKSVIVVIVVLTANTKVPISAFFIEEEEVVWFRINIK
jgi:hypothetical protein